MVAPSPRAILGRRTVYGHTEQRRPRGSKRHETKVRPVWWNCFSLQGRSQRPQNCYNAHGVNHSFSDTAPRLLLASSQKHQDTHPRINPALCARLVLFILAISNPCLYSVSFYFVLIFILAISNPCLFFFVFFQRCALDRSAVASPDSPKDGSTRRVAGIVEPLPVFMFLFFFFQRGALDRSAVASPDSPKDGSTRRVAGIAIRNRGRRAATAGHLQGEA